jgi:hypothetical protein
MNNTDHSLPLASSVEKDRPSSVRALSRGQKIILDRLDARLRLYGLDCWATPTEIAARTDFNSGSAARVLRQLLTLGLVDSRKHDRYNSRFECFEYRRSLQSATVPQSQVSSTAEQSGNQKASS